MGTFSIGKLLRKMSLPPVGFFPERSQWTHNYSNVIPIPGSKNKGRVVENLDVSKVELTDGEFHSLEKALDVRVMATGYFTGNSRVAVLYEKPPQRADKKF